MVNMVLCTGMMAVEISYSTVKACEPLMCAAARGVLDELREGGRPAYDVAIKTTRPTALERQRELLLDEAAIMAQFANHPNVRSVCSHISLVLSI